jgi:hypothetical protein
MIFKKRCSKPLHVNSPRDRNLPKKRRGDNYCWAAMPHMYAERHYADVLQTGELLFMPWRSSGK